MSVLSYYLVWQDLLTTSGYSESWGDSLGVRSGQMFKRTPKADVVKTVHKFHKTRTAHWAVEAQDPESLSCREV